MLMQKMKIIFMGTPEFAVPSLEQLSKNFDVIAVVTVPDKPAGRGLGIRQSAVKLAALRLGLPVLQPANLKDPVFVSALAETNAEVQVVVAFRMLPQQVWEMPPLGTYNLHGSLLPKYRGAAPINHAIMRGEKETGLTVFKLKHEIDSGNILMQKSVAIPGDMNAGELHDIMKEEGADLLLRAMHQIAAHRNDPLSLKFITQDNSKVTYAPKLTKDLANIRWDSTSPEIHDLVRGLSPNPGAFSLLKNDTKEINIKILSAFSIEDSARGVAGTVESDGKNFLHVVCSEGRLGILEVQQEGKKRMTTGEFLRGFRIKPGALFVRK
jgi:methionyl-tRNA formyltransferase